MRDRGGGRHADRRDLSVRAVEPHRRMNVIVPVQYQLDAMPVQQRAQLCLDIRESPPEFSIAEFQRGLRFDTQLARNIRDHKQQVTYLFTHTHVIGLFFRLLVFVNRGPQFANFFLQLLKNIFNLFPVETDARDFS